MHANEREIERTAFAGENHVAVVGLKTLTTGIFCDKRINCFGSIFFAGVISLAIGAKTKADQEKN